MNVRWLLPLVAAPVAQVAYAAQYMTIEQAQRAAFPDANAFAAIALDKAASGVPGAPPGWSPKVWQARAGERSLGWLLVDQVIGKSELITYAVAIDSRGALVSVEVLE